MGFGLMLVGFLITYVVALNTYGVAFRLLGYLIITYAAHKLSVYEKSFRFVFFSAITLVLSSVMGIMSVSVGFMYDNMILDSDPFGARYDAVMSYVEAALVLALQLVLLFAIRRIAKETEVSKIELNAGRNIFFVVLYYLLSIVGYLPFPFKEDYARYMGLPITLLYFVWIAFQIGLIFSCYARICDESDVEMERKPSRFAFVNKFREELDEKQERAKASAEQYRREKLEKRKEKLNRKK